MHAKWKNSSSVTLNCISYDQPVYHSMNRNLYGAHSRFLLTELSALKLCSRSHLKTQTHDSDTVRLRRQRPSRAPPNPCHKGEKASSPQELHIFHDTGYRRWSAPGAMSEKTLCLGVGYCIGLMGLKIRSCGSSMVCIG